MKFNQKALVIMLFVSATCLLPIAPANGYSQDVDRIPNGGVFSCDTCHSPSNDFFGPYDSAGGQWTAALAALDSDGDGYSNGVELQDPSGAWSQGQADPGNPDLVTNPGDASSHPSPATATPTPSDSTPTPTWTPGSSTPTWTPGASTPTPAGCSTTGVRLTMPSELFKPGDMCSCTAFVCNADSTPISGNPLFVILEIAGSYYFAPGFSNYEYYTMTFQSGETSVTVLPEFVWPSGAGSFTGAKWYGALTDPGITTLVGELGMFAFGWSE